MRVWHVFVILVACASASPMPSQRRRSVDVAMACPVAEGHLTMFGVLKNDGKIYMSSYDGTSWEHVMLGSAHSEIITSTSNPNGLAYDRNTGMILYSDVIKKRLYSFNPRTGASIRLGDLIGQADGAACKNGTSNLDILAQVPCCTLTMPQVCTIMEAR